MLSHPIHFGSVSIYAFGGLFFLKLSEHSEYIVLRLQKCSLMYPACFNTQKIKAFLIVLKNSNTLCGFSPEFLTYSLSFSKSISTSAFCSSIFFFSFIDTSKMLFVHAVCFMSEMQNRKAFPSTIKNLLVFEDSQKAKAFFGLQKSLISESAQDLAILTCSKTQTRSVAHQKSCLSFWIFEVFRNARYQQHF